MAGSLHKGSSTITQPTAFLNWMNAAQSVQAQAMMQNAYNNAYDQAQMAAMRNANPYAEFKSFQQLHTPAAPRPTEIPKTAASRVARSDWEAEEDRKDADLNAWLSSIGMDHLHVGTDAE